MDRDLERLWQVGAGYTSEDGEKTGVTSPFLAPSGVILDAELTLETPERLWYVGCGCVGMLAKLTIDLGSRQVFEHLIMRLVRVFIPKSSLGARRLTAFYRESVPDSGTFTR